ncbi:MAG: cupin domain-containing protein [Pseudomonadota bacterium]
MTDAISFDAKQALFEDRWSPKKLASVDGYEIKIAKAEGEFVWHAHEGADEFFMVTKGCLIIEREGMESVTLNAGEMYVVPKGLRHKPVAAPYAEIMLFERAGIVNTGDETSELTAMVEEI